MTSPLQRALDTIRAIRARTEGHGSVWGSREILRLAEEDLRLALDEQGRASHLLYGLADELELRAQRLRQIGDALLQRELRESVRATDTARVAKR